MSTYIVTRVRKAPSADGSHTHIEGVCTNDGSYHSRLHVVDSIIRGDSWRTNAGGYSAPIRVVPRCPIPGCAVAPYIQTNPDSTRKDNLENLDRC